MNLQRVLPSLVVGLVAAVALAGCGKISNSYGNATKTTSANGSAAQSSAPASGSAVVPATAGAVTIQNFAFVPQTLTVKVGTKVTWTNKDSTVHDVVSADSAAIDTSPNGLFNSGQLAQGESFSFTFTKAGTYYYYCTIHASMATMHATVVVK